MSTSLARPFSKILQHGVAAATRPDVARQRIKQLLGRPVGARKVGLRQSEDRFDRMAEVVADAHRLLADLDDQLAHAGQLERVVERQADHGERPRHIALTMSFVHFAARMLGLISTLPTGR